MCGLLLPYYTYSMLCCLVGYYHVYFITYLLGHMQLPIYCVLKFINKLIFFFFPVTLKGLLTVINFII